MSLENCPTNEDPHYYYYYKDKQPFSMWQRLCFTFMPGNLDFRFKLGIEVIFCCPHL